MRSLLISRHITDKDELLSLVFERNSSPERRDVLINKEYIVVAVGDLKRESQDLWENPRKLATTK